MKRRVFTQIVDVCIERQVDIPVHVGCWEGAVRQFLTCILMANIRWVGKQFQLQAVHAQVNLTSED
jgi:hypothetical protein